MISVQWCHTGYRNFLTFVQNLIILANKGLKVRIGIDEGSEEVGHDSQVFADKTS